MVVELKMVDKCILDLVRKIMVKNEVNVRFHSFLCVSAKNFTLLVLDKERKK